MKHLFHISLSIFSNFCYAQSTSEFKELFLRADSISMIDRGFEEEELLYPDDLSDKGLSEFCYPEHLNYSIASQDRANRLFNSLNFQKTDDVLFCGFDYTVTGFSNKEEIFYFELNSECNYILSALGRFYISEFESNETLKSVVTERTTTCFFLNSKLLEGYINSQKQNHQNTSLEFTSSMNTGEYSVTTIRK